MIEIGRTCSTYGAVQKYTQSFRGKPRGIQFLGRPRRRRENIKKMDLKDVSFDATNWMVLLKVGTSGGIM